MRNICLENHFTHFVEIKRVEKGNKRIGGKDEMQIDEESCILVKQTSEQTTIMTAGMYAVFTWAERTTLLLVPSARASACRFLINTTARVTTGY